MKDIFFFNKMFMRFSRFFLPDRRGFLAGCADTMAFGAITAAVTMLENTPDGVSDFPLDHLRAIEADEAVLIRGRFRADDDDIAIVEIGGAKLVVAADGDVADAGAAGAAAVNHDVNTVADFKFQMFAGNIQILAGIDEVKIVVGGTVVGQAMAFDSFQAAAINGVYPRFTANAERKFVDYDITDVA